MRARLSHLVETHPLRPRNRRARAGHRKPPAPPEQPMSPERRMRQGGGPEDQALYACSCGYAFEAHVSTSVRCPHCGDDQAW
jgi:hypothetical protein